MRKEGEVMKEGQEVSKESEGVIVVVSGGEGS